MPAYRFSWDAFDDRTVTALAVRLGYDPQGDRDPARSFLAKRVKRPTAEFVGEMRDVLVSTWLPEYRGLDALVERLMEAGLGPGSRPRTLNGRLDYVRTTRSSKRFRQFLLEAMHRFGDQDRPADDDGSVDDFVRRFAIVVPAEQAPDLREPHSYQVEAWQRLQAQLAESEHSGAFRGLLVMPTGSGKTYTAVRWLVSNVIARLGRVLWLAHRTELLNQAAAEFHRLSVFASSRERLRVRLVSGDHCAATQIDPADDVVVASIASLARAHAVVDELVADPQLFVVIDEAHHAPARSYRNLIEKLEARKRFRLLGLTATPTRTRESERGVLHEMFGGRVIHQVEVKTLIERRILARPRPVHVQTRAEVEAGVTLDDLAHWETFNDLSEAWLDRIAHLEDRNQVIVEHYLANRERYGQTLIFAINVAHAALLTDRLRQCGVSVEYVASYRPDGTSAEPDDVIRLFREKQLDVLVNVQMVTEGVDVPAIRTVFLARPTSSEILVRQMIGRALRGPAAGGTPEAFLVSFEDHWTQFRDWASPLDLVPEIVGAAPNEDRAPTPAPELVEHLPWELIRAVATRLREQSIEYKADAFEAVPHGWYVLEREDEDVSLNEPIAVYAHQRPCWEAFLESVASRPRGSIDPTVAAAEYEEFFGDCDPPAPSTHDIGRVLRHFALGGHVPTWTTYDDRRLADPYEIADEVWSKDLGERAKGELIEARFGSLAKAIYPTLREFRSAVEDALYEKTHPDDSTRQVRGVPIFSPRPEEQMRPGPAHDLAPLMAEVLRVGSEILGVTLAHSGELLWTKRLVKGWYGHAWWEPTTPSGHGLIRINKLMDSPDVSPDTMKFLLWHEYLHLYLKGGHSKTFREIERKWPDWLRCDREMDSLNERFGVQYW